MTFIKRLSAAVTIGVALTLLVIPADALNGDIYVMKCACIKTADFVAAAEQQAQQLFQAGQYPIRTYLVASTSRASTAYISITGTEVDRKEPHFQITAAIPVDANGNSLAGLSESAQEAIYAAVDINVMGTSRNYPIDLIGNPGGGVSEIPSYSTSDDAAITIGVILDDPSVLANLTAGDTVTITWNYNPGLSTAYQITAIFIVSTPNGGWQLTWKSATKNGKPIDRKGNPIANPNTSGLGGGSGSVPGFGPGAAWSFLIAGGDLCFASGEVDFPDGSSYITGGWGPC